MFVSLEGMTLEIAFQVFIDLLSFARFFYLIFKFYRKTFEISQQTLTHVTEAWWHNTDSSEESLHCFYWKISWWDTPAGSWQEWVFPIIVWCCVFLHVIVSVNSHEWMWLFKILDLRISIFIDQIARQKKKQNCLVLKVILNLVQIQFFDHFKHKVSMASNEDIEIFILCLEKRSCDKDDIGSRVVVGVVQFWPELKHITE